MTRTLTFVVKGDTRTRVHISENSDNTLTFELTVPQGAHIDDLRGLFFDLMGLEERSKLVLSGDKDTRAQTGVDSLGRSAAIRGRDFNALGEFDAGVEFGTTDRSDPTQRTTSFTLAHPNADLTLDMIDLESFGILMVPVDKVVGAGNFLLRLGVQVIGAKGINILNKKDDYWNSDARDTPSVATVLGVVAAEGIDIATDQGMVTIGPDGELSYQADDTLCACLPTIRPSYQHSSRSA